MRRTCTAWYVAIDVTRTHISLHDDPHVAMKQYRRLGAIMKRATWKLYEASVDVGQLGALLLRPMCRFHGHRLREIRLYQLTDTFMSSEMHLTFLAESCPNLHTLELKNVRPKVHLHPEKPVAQLKTLLLSSCYYLDIDFHTMPALEQFEYVDCRSVGRSPKLINAPNLHSLLYDTILLDSPPRIIAHSITRLAINIDHVPYCSPTVLSGVTHLYLVLDVLIFMIESGGEDFDAHLTRCFRDFSALECIVVDTGYNPTTTDEYLDHCIELIAECLPCPARLAVAYHSGRKYAPVVMSKLS